MERAQFAGEFTRWSLARARVDQQTLAALTSQVLPVSVNISGQLLADEAFVRFLGAAVGGDPTIELEITETAVIDNPDDGLANLDRLAQAGVRIIIDDYGTGLSSLAYLRRLPASELKIDKLFVMSIADNQRDPLIVRSTIDLAHALGMKVTAEGVERRATLELLRVMGCDFAQGYVIAPPLELPALVEWLARSEPAVAAGPLDLRRLTSV